MTNVLKLKTNKIHLLNIWNYVWKYKTSFSSNEIASLFEIISKKECDYSIQCANNSI
jgi:hypothetical protein